MSPKITITFAEPSDYEKIAEIYNQSADRFFNIYSEDEREAAGDALHATAEKIPEGRIIRCARDVHDIPIGYSVFRKKNDHIVWISSLYIDSDKQNQGIGTELLKDIESFAREWGCDAMVLETHRNAHWELRFYEKDGFELINERMREFPFSYALEKPPVPNRPLLGEKYQALKTPEIRGFLAAEINIIPVSSTKTPYSITRHRQQRK